MTRFLSWNEFDACVQNITLACRHKRFSGVYGFPRGGLCLAVAISHSLRIPLLKDIKSNALVVDDVVETGLTLNKAKRISGITAFVWFSKMKNDWWNTVDNCALDEWLVFPWENSTFAVKEEESYRLSRRELN